jgi:hypothetical protein
MRLKIYSVPSDDLFSAIHAGASAVLDNDEPVPEFVTVARQIWDGIISRSASWAASDGQQDKFQSLIEYGDWSSAALASAKVGVKDLRSDFLKLRKQTTRRFMGMAARELGVGTQSAVFEEDEINNAIRIGLIDPAFGDVCHYNSSQTDILNPIDFEKTWRFLYARYGTTSNGQSAGAISALKVAAKELVSSFWLSNSEPKYKSGYLILDQTEYWRMDLNGWGHEIRNRIVSICGNLNIALSHSGLAPIFKSDTLALTDYANHNRTVPSGEKFQLGEHIVVRPYKSRFEYRLDPAAAAAFQSFISEFATIKSDE